MHDRTVVVPAPTARQGPRSPLAVGWVGIDVYPGTWSAPAMSTYPTASQVGATIIDSLRCLRTEHMVTAGLSSAVTITVAETGYPTDATRSEATQADVLRAIIASVQSVQQTLRRHRSALVRAPGRQHRQRPARKRLRPNARRLQPQAAFTAYQQIIAAQGI